jgi:diguanylate cyclase (GGDEF)-like protein
MPNVAEKSLLEQMHIDDIEIQRRKELLGLSPAEEELLAQAGSLIANRVDAIVGEFYRQQISIQEVAITIGDRETLERLHEAQKRYVAGLFSGFYDQDYVNYRLRIGLVHKRIGVRPKHFLSAISALRLLVRDALNQIITAEQVRSATLDALDKVLYFDMAFVFDTYIRSLVTEIELARDKAEQYAAMLEERVAERTRELERLSRSDPLTGLLNMRAFREELRHELSRANRYPECLSLIYFDVDDFKHINDSKGHPQGDAVLKAIAQVLGGIKREPDLVARYGGDEFCVALPDTDVEGARRFASRLEHEFGLIHPEYGLSIGIVQAGTEQAGGDIDSLIKAADKNMYEVKERRRMELLHSGNGRSKSAGGPALSSGTALNAGAGAANAAASNDRQT